MKIVNKSKNITLGLLTLLFIYVSDDLFFFSVIDRPVLNYVKFFIQIVCFLTVMTISMIKGMRFRRNETGTIIILLCLLVLLSMIINVDIRLGYIFSILIFLTSYLIHVYVGTERVMDLLYKSIIIIMILSLIAFVPIFIDFSLLKLFPTIPSIGKVPFKLVGINVFNATDNFVRNYGPFREPGVFQIYINIAFLYGLFYRRENNWKVIMLFVITLMTTFSTTGYIALALILGAYYCFEFKKVKKEKSVVLILLILVVCYMALFTNFLINDSYGSVFGKLFNSNSSISFASRFESVIFNFRIFIENPLIGKGITYEAQAFDKLMIEKYGRLNSNANTIMIQMARFGIVFAAVFIYRNVLFVNSIVRKNILSILLACLGVLCLYMSEDITYSSITSIILFAQFDRNMHGRKL